VLDPGRRGATCTGLVGVALGLKNRRFFGTETLATGLEPTLEAIAAFSLVSANARLASAALSASFSELASAGCFN
jgi:hypothetical protein